MKIMLKSKHNFLRHALAGAAGLALMAGHVTGSAATAGICDPDGGYVVAYYNGTMALPDDADAQRAAMRRARHEVNTTGTSETINGEVVHYETFYSANTAQLEALAAAYRQSLDGALSTYWEYFWDFLGGDASNWTALATKTGDSRFSALSSSFIGQVTAQTAAALSQMKADVPSSTTLGNKQKTRIQALYTERQKVTLVSQGEQGSLFADKGFASIGSPADSSALRLSLAARPGSDTSALSAKMAALITPTNVENNRGFFTATLSWTLPSSVPGVENDFDMHIIEPAPGSKHVHYTDESKAKGGGGSLQGDAGYLDKDSTTIGPEHYYVTCDESKLVEGVYQISVTQEGLEVPTGTYATLQIATAKSGEIFSKTFRGDTVTGYIQPDKLVPTVKVQVSKDPATGRWSASIAP